MEEEKKTTQPVEAQAPKAERNNNRHFDHKRNDRPRREEKPKLYDEEIINIGRVVKVTQGGRNQRFAVTVAMGDRKGKIGIGTGKSAEIPDAKKKAEQMAVKNMVKISLDQERTIPHEAIGTRGASRVLLKPAKEGTGVKAGGAVRSVLELAGVKDILSKSLGSSKKLNMAYATLEALKAQKTVEQIAKLRGKKVEDIR